MANQSEPAPTWTVIAAIIVTAFALGSVVVVIINDVPTDGFEQPVRPQYGLMIDAFAIVFIYSVTLSALLVARYKILCWFRSRREAFG